MSRDDDFKTRFDRLKELRKLREDMKHAHRSREDAHRIIDEHHRLREAERARRTGRKPLDADAIAAAAVAIADAQGVEEVSMRKIAAVLGSGTMSLYHYVRTKEDLLAAMDDRIMGEILVPAADLKAGWRKGISAIARNTRDAYRRHPWALSVQAKGGPSVNAVRHVEQSLAAMSGTGLSFDNAMAVAIIVDDFVFGHSLRIAERRFERGQDVAEMNRALEAISSFVETQLEAGDFPNLVAAMGDETPADFMLRMAGTFDPEQWFETGLEALLDGLAKRFAITE